MLGEIPLREVELSEPNSIATGRAPRQETACRAGWDTIDINRNESIINPVVHDRHDQGGCRVRQNGWRRNARKEASAGSFERAQGKPDGRCLESADSLTLSVEH